MESEEVIQKVAKGFAEFRVARQDGGNYLDDGSLFDPPLVEYVPRGFGEFDRLGVVGNYGGKGGAAGSRQTKHVEEEDVVRVGTSQVLNGGSSRGIEEGDVLHFGGTCCSSGWVWSEGQGRSLRGDLLFCGMRLM